jgi:hypothetical protein
LIVCVSLVAGCDSDKGEILFLNFKSYSNPRKVLWRYKNAVLARDEEEGSCSSLITINAYQLDSFEVNLTFLYYDEKLCAVLVDVDNRNADRFELKYKNRSTMNVGYERDIGPCTVSTDIYHTPTTTCFKWADMRIINSYLDD